MKSQSVPSLNALQTFEAVARNNSFTLGAQELNVTQGAVSKQIRLLEQQFQNKLFVRKTTKTELTDFGRELYNKLRPVFVCLREAFSERDRSLPVAIKVPMTLADRWLLPRFNQLRKFVGFNLKITSSWIYSVDFVKEPFDFAIVFSKHGEGKFPVLDETLICVATEAYMQSLSATDPIDIINESTLIYPSSHLNEWHTFLDALGYSKHINMKKNTLITQSMSSAAHAACNGIGLAIVNPAFVEQELASGVLQKAIDSEVDAPGKYYLLSAPHMLGSSEEMALQSWFAKSG